MSDKIREEAANTAMMVNAYLRVALRRWLRKEFGEGLPDHLWLDHDLPDLIDAVVSRGGDAEALMERAREEIVERISQDKGYLDD